MGCRASDDPTRMSTQDARNCGYTSVMPPSEGLLRAARGVLGNSGVLYDPEYPDMNIPSEEEFRYHVSMGLWQIALQHKKFS